MNGYRLVASLVAAGQHRAAGELAALLAQREEDAPRMKALEFELAWLRRYVLHEGYAASVTKYSNDGEETPLVWERTPGAIKGELGQFVVLRGNPRLEAILEGSLPSLDAFREGRTP